MIDIYTSFFLRIIYLLVHTRLGKPPAQDKLRQITYIFADNLQTRYRSQGSLVSISLKAILKNLIKSLLFSIAF